jgi:recombination protein RecA
MADEKKEKLELTLSKLQKRWGTGIIGRSRKKQLAEFPAISTSFPQLDQAIGIGGIPRGRISELVGIPTSGIVTLALKIIAQIQKQGGTAVFLDLTRTFDPGYAWRCGVQLSHLTLVLPFSVQQSLSILADFAINGGIDLLILDMPLSLQTEPHNALKLTSTLGRVLSPISRNNCTLLFLTSMLNQTNSTDLKQANLPHFATLRLLLSKERWLYKKRDVCGYKAQVLIAKNKLHPPGQKVPLEITLNCSAEGDGL